eukprot:12938476-Prorocentrum_lima.AAC.1
MPGNYQECSPWSLPWSRSRQGGEPRRKTLRPPHADWRLSARTYFSSDTTPGELLHDEDGRRSHPRKKWCCCARADGGH